MFDSFKKAKEALKALKKFVAVKNASFVKKLRDGNASGRVRAGDKTFDNIESDKEMDEIANETELSEVEWDVPDDVSDIEFEDNISDEAKIEMIKSIQKAHEKPYEEPSDKEMDYVMEKDDRKKSHKEYTTSGQWGYGWVSSKDRDTHPSEWEQAYYPAGKDPFGEQEGNAPDIGRMKEWVENVKIADMTDAELKEEWRNTTGRTIKDKESKSFLSDLLTESQRRSLIDSIAYKVARKIWYVGRKPSSMSDWEWNEHTKDMRPPEGSFGGFDHMYDFPYDKTYVYKSAKWE